jgi:hypothetical protein
LVEIALLRFGQIVVHGDLDSVIFGHFHTQGKTWRDHLEWIAGSDWSYAEEKASIGGSLARVDDEEVALSDLLDWRRHRYIDCRQARKIWKAIEADGVEHARWVAWEECSGGLEAEDVGALGRCTAPRVIAAQAAITRAHLLLTEYGEVRARN